MPKVWRILNPRQLCKQPRTSNDPSTRWTLNDETLNCRVPDGLSKMSDAGMGTPGNLGRTKLKRSKTMLSLPKDLGSKGCKRNLPSSDVRRFRACVDNTNPQTVRGKKHGLDWQAIVRKRAWAKVLMCQTCTETFLVSTHRLHSSSFLGFLFRIL